MIQVQVHRHLHHHVMARKSRWLVGNGPEIDLLNMRWWSHKEMKIWDQKCERCVEPILGGFGLAADGASPSALVHLGVFVLLCITYWESIYGFSFCIGHVLDMRLIYLSIYFLCTWMHFYGFIMWVFLWWCEMKMSMWCIVTLVCVFLDIIMHDVMVVCFLYAVVDVPI